MYRVVAAWRSGVGVTRDASCQPPLVGCLDLVSAFEVNSVDPQDSARRDAHIAVPAERCELFQAEHQAEGGCSFVFRGGWIDFRVLGVRA